MKLSKENSQPSEKVLKKQVSPFDPAGLKERLAILDGEIENENFWEDQENARRILKEKKSIENKINTYDGLLKDLNDIEEFVVLADEEDDEDVAQEILSSVNCFEKALTALKLKILLTGQYDANNAIISVHGGSGGTDAKDWAEMLCRMYTRWAEKKGYKVKILDYQDDKEGGINSATMLIAGENAYGYLKNEKGVHRLVRISPFDSSGRRHTSFASLDVIPEIDDDIQVDIEPDDIRIDTFKASGAGGQHVNKTDSAIRIMHLPTNIVVSCQNERSQHQNRETAMKLLKSKLVELKEQEHKKNLKELRGDYSQITWGSQIRSYVFQPYTMVKDHRTGAEVGNVNAVMDGDIDYLINEKLKCKDE